MVNRNTLQVAVENLQAAVQANEVDHPTPLEDEECLVEVNVAPVALAAAEGIVQPRPRRPVERPRPPHPYLPEFPPHAPAPEIARVAPAVTDQPRQPERRPFNALLAELDVQNILQNRLRPRARPN